MHIQLLDPGAARPLGEEAAALASERGFTHNASQARTYLGWCRAMEGDTSGGAAAVQALDEYVASGSRSTLTWLFIVAADALRLSGHSEEALQRLASAEEIISRSGEVAYLTWTRWLRALVHIERHAPGAAEPLLVEALDWSRRLQMPVCELRNALPLARIWADAGRVSEAHALVTQGAARFAPGAHTPVLRSAATFLSREQ